MLSRTLVIQNIINSLYNWTSISKKKKNLDLTITPYTNIIQNGSWDFNVTTKLLGKNTEENL